MSVPKTQNIVNATKWSSVTEIAVRLISPITTIVLARLLTPESFGVLVTATMVISFAEIFTDAGFQKYLIQHEFPSRNDLYQSTNVAFWSNLVFSLAIWLAIVIFCEPIATLVGNKGRGDVIAVSCICIPLAAFSSIQMALYKRDFDFKTLFLVRIVGACIPLVITIPLAIITRSYWALIIGMIALNLSNALILTVKSRWKPKFFYDFSLLKAMLSFTIWSMIEAVSVWLTSYVDFFIVGTMLSQHYLGLYRTAMSTVNQIMGIITSATVPILFSSLSRLQDSNKQLIRFFLKFQKIVGLLVIPLGVGIYIFRDLITEILLGNQWTESARLLGWWGLTSSLTAVLSQYCSEIFRAKGRPKLSVLAQVLHICFLVPTIIWAAHYSFDFLCDMRALVRLTSVVINLSILYYLIHLSPLKIFKNLSVPFIGSAIMAVFVLFLQSLGSSIVTQLIYVLLAIIVYFSFVMLFRRERTIVVNLKKYFKR